MLEIEHFATKWLESPWIPIIKGLCPINITVVIHIPNIDINLFCEY